MRVFFICFLLLPVLGLGQITDPNYVSGQIYIKLKNTVSIPDVDKGESLNKSEELPFIQTLLGNKSTLHIGKPFFTPNSARLQRIYRVKFLPSESLDEILDKLNQDPTVEYAERIPIMRNLYVPNDYSTQSQYNLDNINAEQAWDVTKGSINVVVAVTDTGVLTNHEDLAANLVVGRDVANGDDNPNPDYADGYHGTHVAGIVGAVTNNNKGISSLGFNIKILPVKCSDGTRDPDDGRLLITHGYEGIAWAINNSAANIINMSWGGKYSRTGEDIIEYALSMGAILVSSAGNDDTSAKTKSFPAAYDGVIAVASTNITDTRSSFSNYGSWVDISAPGSAIKSTLLDNSYGYLSGTSMASPLVASLAALMQSVNPTLTSNHIEVGLKATADNIDAQNPFYVGQLGAGRINAFKAVTWASTVQSTTSGSWTGSNWTYQAPSVHTNPVIQAGHTITVPAATYQVRNTLNVNGTLDLISTSSIINVNNN